MLHLLFILESWPIGLTGRKDKTMNEIQAILYTFLLESGQEQKAEAYRAKCEEENKNAEAGK